MRNDLRCVVKVLRRGARIILTLYALAAVAGKSASPAAFFATCSVEALDYLVALRKAGRAESGAFYLECYAKASTYKVSP